MFSFSTLVIEILMSKKLCVKRTTFLSFHREKKFPSWRYAKSGWTSEEFWGNHPAGSCAMKMVRAWKAWKNHESSANNFEHAYKTKKMQERLWLSIEGAYGIKNPKIFESRPQGKTLEVKAPRKMGNLGFS